MSVFPSSGVLAIRLDDLACLSLFGSILIHVVVIFGIGFIAVQEKPEPVLPTLRVTLVNAPLEKPEDASFLAQYSQSGNGTETPFKIAQTPSPSPKFNPSFNLNVLLKKMAKANLPTQKTDSQ